MFPSRDSGPFLSDSQQTNVGKHEFEDSADVELQQRAVELLQLCKDEAAPPNFKVFICELASLRGQPGPGVETHASVRLGNAICIRLSVGSSFFEFLG